MSNGSGPAADLLKVNARNGRKRKHHKNRTPHAPPRGDIGSSGGDYGIPEANKAKRTNKRVRRNTRAVYTAQPAPQRRRIAQTTRGREDETSKLIQHEHQSRVARNREIAKGYFQHGDTKGDKDRGRAKTFLEAHPEILHPKQERKSSDIFLTDRKALKAAGFKPTHEGLVQAPLRVPLTALKAGQYTLETAAEHPDQIPRLAKDSGEAILSIPAGLIRAGLHPKKAAKEIAHDYSRRYGGIYNNKSGAKKQFKERQQKEGILPEVLDAAGVLSAGGATAGRGIQKVAEAGAVGKKAEKIATAERPRLQTSGGAVPQDKSRNFFRNAGQAAVDTRRAKHGAKKIAKADQHEGRVPVEVAEAARRSEKGIPTVAPITRHGARKAQRVAVAKNKGRAITRQKVEQQTAEKVAFHALHKVDAHAFKYATQYGIRSAEQAKEVLPKLLQHIEKNRKDMKRGVPKRQDEIPAIKRLIEHPQAFDDPKLHQAVGDMSALSRKVAEQSPGFSAEAAAVRRVAPQGELHGVVRAEGESAGAFVKRVREATGDLAPGEYFPSVKRLDAPFMNRTTGGTVAQADVKAYTGALTRTGRENAGKDVFVNSMQKEIRRKHNWNLVSKTFEEHTLPWSRDQKLATLQDQVDARNIDPESISYVNLRKVKLAQDLEDVGAGSAHGESAFGTADSQIEDLLNKAFVNPKDVSTSVDNFDKTGWAIVPREVEKELKSGFQQSSPLGRMNRITKGKISRVLLSNPVWLQFQMASNAMMAGAHRTGIVSAIKAHYKFRQPEWKALESDIGIHRFYDDQAKLGSVADTNHALLNSWRAWQKVGMGSKFGFAAHPVREFFNVFHRVDTAQNNLFRRAVFYNDVKREAYRRMAADSGHMVAAQQRIMNTLQLHDPQRIMEAIVQDPRQFERHAQAVDDFMGNWTTYTHKERLILGNALFGGFIRFSMRLVFYTMPMKHPIMASIVTQMGRLEKDELQRIFGTDVPPWEVGNYYSADGKARFQAIRLNPFANALTSLGGEGVPQALVGSVSPLIGMGLSQLGKGNVGFQQPWTIGGKQVQINTPVKNSDRLKILLAEFLKLSPYYRDIEKYGAPGLVKPLRGRQNSTSSLVFREPRKYDLENSKRPTQTQEAIDRNEALKREQAKASPLSALTPIKTSGTAVITKSRQYEASKKKGAKKKKGGEFSLSGGGGADHQPGEFSLDGGRSQHKPGEFSLNP